jgi:CheY-like chemotaxis protein
VRALRVLHVEDEPDIREVAEVSLGLDPDLVSRSCGSGEEALAIAEDWLPDIILLDVMMPVMDGPATLALLRANVSTADIPVVFMTARAQSRELDLFRSLGAVGVIPKPFDPMTLAASVRNYANPPDELATLRGGFLRRLIDDAAALTRYRSLLESGMPRRDALTGIKDMAHSLAGAGGIYGFAEISAAAGTLEEAAIAALEAPAGVDIVARALDHLLANIPAATNVQRSISPLAISAQR